MKGIKAGLPIFLLLLIISIIIFIFSQNPLVGILQTITVPIQKWTFAINASPSITQEPQELLQEENNQLRVQLAQMQELQKDNQALHDQFAVSTPSPQKLLPASIVGMQQNALIIDKGQSDNIHSGNIVIFKNNLIGIIGKITPHLSLVTLLSDPSTSFTAQAEKTGANGIIKSEDGGIVTFENVDLSDSLKINDIVATKGDLNIQGQGYPPNLVVGKIVSVNKQESSLFQSAKIQSLVSLSQLRIVFMR